MHEEKTELLAETEQHQMLLNILVDIKCEESVDEPSVVRGGQDLSMFVTKISTFQFYLHNKLNTRQIKGRISLAVSQYVIEALTSRCMLDVSQLCCDCKLNNKLQRLTHMVILLVALLLFLR